VNAATLFRDPVLRDLHWALSSPPLLGPADTGSHWPAADWFRDISQAYRTQLAELDACPQPLRAAVHTRKDQRLGKYFETLWRFWLENNGRYRLLCANLPVRSRGRALGEFDLLVKDSETGKTLHWELALKFYLGIGDTAQLENWWGPAQRDRLDIKTTRLLTHQSKLSQHPEAAALLERLGVRIDEAWVILKGRLFYRAGHPPVRPPDACPGHLRGFWIPAAVFAGFEEALWLPLDRDQWLAPQSHIKPSACLRGSDMAARWRLQPLRRALCIARVESGAEIERGFVVPDGWGSAAQT
jgi:hypothetical protein